MVYLKNLCFGVACKQGTFSLQDTWFSPSFLDLLMFQLLRPIYPNLPCLFATFHIEFLSELSRCCFNLFVSNCSPPWICACPGFPFLRLLILFTSNEHVGYEQWRDKWEEFISLYCSSVEAVICRFLRGARIQEKKLSSFIVHRGEAVIRRIFLGADPGGK